MDNRKTMRYSHGQFLRLARASTQPIEANAQQHLHIPIIRNSKISCAWFLADSMLSSRKNWPRVGKKKENNSRMKRAAIERFRTISVYNLIFFSLITLFLSLVCNSIRARACANEQRTRNSRYSLQQYVRRCVARARMHAHAEAHVGIDTSQAHQHVVSRYPMWVNVSRTCELACKMTIRVSWMKHRHLSLSFSPSFSHLFPLLSLAPSLPPCRFRDKASSDFCEIFIARARTRRIRLGK